MPKYVVDSSVWVAAFPRRASVKFRDAVASILANNDIYVSGIIKAEVLQGAVNRGQFVSIEKRLGTIPVAELESARSWQQVAENAFLIRTSGFSVPLTDILIATQAQGVGAIVVHVDRYFEMISSALKMDHLSLIGYL